MHIYISHRSEHIVFATNLTLYSKVVLFSVITSAPHDPKSCHSASTICWFFKNPYTLKQAYQTDYNVLAAIVTPYSPLSKQSYGQQFGFTKLPWNILRRWNIVVNEPKRIKYRHFHISQYCLSMESSSNHYKNYFAWLQNKSGKE